MSVSCVPAPARRSARAALHRLVAALLAVGMLLATAPPASASAALVAVVRSPDGRLDVQQLVVAASTTQTAIQRLQARPDVVAVDVDVPTTLLADRRSEQWPISAIGAASAWRTARGDGTVVAVLDTGVDARHPDLAAGQVARGADMTGGGSDGRRDRVGHGTHVAGVVAATSDRVGVTGVAHASTILPVQVLGDNGGGLLSWAAAGIIWAVDHGADVVTMSLGAGRGSSVLDAAVAHAVAHDVVVVAAAGNDGSDRVAWPAAHPDVIAVGAVDQSGRVAGFSNRGAPVELVAPGVRVLSTCVVDRWCLMTGTSMATPHVAAAAAIVRSQRPDLGADEVRDVLASTARDLAPTGRDRAAGHGALDLAAAVHAARDAGSDPYAPGSPLRRLAAAAGARELARQTSRDVFPAGAELAVLARDDVFADALTGAALAGGRGPVLFTAGGPAARLSSEAAAELRRLLEPGAPVYVLGGPLAVSERAVRDVEALGLPVRRIAGVTRVETAALVAAEVADEAHVPRVLVARADDWADAVTGSAFAAARRVPVLLTSGDRLDPAARAWLSQRSVDEAVILGGTAAVSARTALDVGALVGRVTRVGGADRAATAGLVAERLWGRRAGAGGDAFVVVEGWSRGAWAPAVAAGAVSAAAEAPQLLARGESLPPATTAYLRRLGYTQGRAAQVTVVGDEGGARVGRALLGLVGS